MMLRNALLKVRNTPRMSETADLPPPVRGLNNAVELMALQRTDALVLDNWLPYPDTLQTRPGYVAHVTGFSAPIRRLLSFSAMNGQDSLWAATDSGVYNVTLSGVVGSPVASISSGKLVYVNFATGANNYLFAVNGVNSLLRYDGATWTSIPTLGTTATSSYSYVEVYRQRLFFIKKNSLTMEYLPPNSISGTPVTYELGSLFKRGGYLVALGTWTIDSGSGPDDHLAVFSSEGEVAVFAGSDPTSLATWSLRGVYFIGAPVGNLPLYKYGGDLLVLCENGLYPLSQAMQSTAIERTLAVSERIRPLFTSAIQQFRDQYGWHISSFPDIPFLLVNIPIGTLSKQYVMHNQSGAWASITGWNASSFASANQTLYFATADGVNRVTGFSDNGENITYTMLSAYIRQRGGQDFHVKLVKPYFESTGAYSFTLGIAADLGLVRDSTSPYSSAAANPGLWGSAIWGEAMWGGSSDRFSDWYTVPDEYSKWKAFYLQVVSKQALVKFFGQDYKYV